MKKICGKDHGYPPAGQYWIFQAVTIIFTIDRIGLHVHGSISWLPLIPKAQFTNPHLNK
jgi:hypothetical protein